MAEFLTMDEAKSKFGTKGRTNAGLTLGIIGTALAAFAGNNGGCGCGNGGGILGNLFGGNNNCCAMQAAENAKTLAMAQGQQADNLSWANRVQSMQDDIDLYTYVNSRALATNERIGNESQVLTNQIWKGRVEDLQEKGAMYVDLLSRDNAQNLRLCDELYKRREQDVQEKADIFERLGSRISELEKKEAATAAALPLMFELNKVNAERYTDACCCKSETNLLMTANGLQAMQQAQQAQQKTQPILDEINREVGSLSLDEQKVLAQMPEYQMAKQTYEAGFMSFLGTKFSQEFVSSADGKVAADNLLATIRKSKEHIHAQLKAKEDKVNTLLELVEQDPEIKKRLDEVMLSKSK